MDKELYNRLVTDNGISLNTLNPGSNEKALSVKDCLRAITILDNIGCPILGGDILTQEGKKLLYAYQSWGGEYHYLNWYCNKGEDENGNDFFKRSIKEAKNAVYEAAKIAGKLEKPCFINLVV